MRIPPVEPLDLTDGPSVSEEVHSLDRSATIISRAGIPAAAVGGINESESLLLSSGIFASDILERTLPMLDVEHAVITETVCGSEVCCQCGRYVGDLSISGATTVEVIASTNTSDATMCGKRKYCNI